VGRQLECHFGNASARSHHADSSNILLYFYCNIYNTNTYGYRALVTMAYYGAFVTGWCFIMLFQAVRINSIHKEIIGRLWSLQTEMAVTESIKIDDGIVEMIEKVRESIDNNYKPVTILGIPATPTLMNVFITYLVSAAIAVLWQRLGFS
jgi:hypothetical protein